MTILLLIYVVAVIILTRVMTALHLKGKHHSKSKVAVALLVVNILGVMLILNL